ncbi:MAG: trypsin-like peptidase domain-containing protein [Pseudomonadota bacterium]|nr:trypsin-like peptidase domain-containing protein [Pseudomonadota bacterium]
MTTIVFADLAFAQSQYVKFEKIENLEGQLAAAEKSSVQINIETEDGVGHCTGTFISNEGLLLTARHCLFDGCLIPMLSTPEKPFDAVVTYPYENFFQGKTCRIQITGFDYEDAEIIAIGGKGFVDLNKEEGQNFESLILQRRPKLYKKWSDEGYFLEGDYIVLRVDKSRSRSCAKLSSAEKNAVQPVTLFSYPMPTERPSGDNSDGKGKFMSLGQTKLDYKNECTNYNLGTIQRSATDLLFSSDAYLFLTADGVSGSSGAAVFNNNGEIIGIFSGSKNNVKKECVGSTLAVNSKAILESVDKQIDNATRAEIAKCGIKTEI